MIQRCYNPIDPKFSRYGARGIRVCDEWRFSFSAYLAYIRSIGFTGAKGQTLDRINNDGHYEPGNMRVTDAKGQSRNSGQNVILDAFGKSNCLGEWADATKITYQTLWARIRVLHWTPERALTEPVRFRSLAEGAGCPGVRGQAGRRRCRGRATVSGC